MRLRARPLRQLYYSARCFSPTPPKCDDTASDRLPWSADPSASELRAHLKRYWQLFGHGAHRYANPNPEHFKRFMLHWARAKGHATLSYMATRKLESIFEEGVQVPCPCLTSPRLASPDPN